MMAQLAGTVEYPDCFSVYGYDSPNACPVCDTIRSDEETPVVLELSGMRSTYSLPSLSGPFWPGVVAHDRILSIGQVELFDI